MIKLSKLPKNSGQDRPAKRLGRGYGSGQGGHTTGRGQKGQKSRGKVKPWFEGGHKPLIHRLPYLGGFKKRASDRFILNLDQINRLFTNGEQVTLETLAAKGCFKRIPRDGVKVLGRGKLTKKVTFGPNIKYAQSVAKHFESSWTKEKASINLGHAFGF